MDLFVVCGGKPLAGQITVGGSKNATLPIMAAALMIDGSVTLTGVPDLADVATLARVLESLGASINRRAGSCPTISGGERVLSLARKTSLTDTGGTITLTAVDESNCVADYDLVRRMRASICVLGPLLAKRGRAIVSLPGGCNIGDRPIDLHLRGLAALGADLRIERGYVVATGKRLRGADIDLAGPRGSTVTGTANLLAAATLARGRTILRNAAREPEITDLANFLVSAGATIAGIGTSTLEVQGVESLHSVAHCVIPDRIEAATLMIAAAITGGDLRLDRVPLNHLDSVTRALRSAGVSLEEVQPHATPGVHSVQIRASGALRSVDVTTAPYPGFPTDLQAQWTALMTRAAGISYVREEVFPERFLHVPELARLGAEISRHGATAVVHGGRPLRGANVMASDLRASAALVLAALAAEGESVIRRIYHLDRGYERLDVKLAALGADVLRRPDEATVAVPPPLPAA
jgi:UDP-N-acetylglucosamine 1-carboxyvinyltransferase